jgi:ABC-type transport system involved in multi-copper enzyme maturation permease subunit
MTAWTIATNTLGESMRKKVISIFLLVAIIMIILSQAFAFFASPGAGIGTQAVGGVSPSSGNRVELIVIKSMAFGVIVLAGLIMSIFLGMDLIPSEIDRRTIYTILSKPVRRSAYIAGKQIGLSLTLAVNIGLMGVVFIGLVFFKTMQIPWEIAVGVLLILVQFIMLGSVALFFSVFLSRNINAALTFFIFVVGMLGDFWQSVGRLSGGSGNKVIESLMKVLHYVIPNFSNFNATNPLIHPEKLVDTNFYQYVFLKTIPYGLVYSAILLLLAIFIFDRKEM